MVLGMGIGLLISFIYFALQQFGKVAGLNGDLSPQLAAWIGNVAFIIVGIFLYWRVRK
jgi:lipopolysaccharide export LptBFGC system permease protein LptF